MQYIKRFGQLGKGDALIAGGKGASLGEMTQAGMPVPPGFVVLATTFDQFLSETSLHSQIEAELDKASIHDTNSVEQASKSIRSMFEATPVPEDIQKQIMDAYVELGADFVAIRSSATAEDSSSASWAGELETYLYSTKSDVIENVKKCWSSLFTPRAIFYRTEKDMKDTHVAVAVVIQKMVPAEVSGICFTVHPVTKDDNHLIIEAGWGLGEAIVGGLITPDSYVIDKMHGERIDTYISEQKKKIIQKGEGGTGEADVLREDQERQKLSDHHIEKLAELAKKIEKHYGSPQDIEWALTDGKIWILQSRPITTL